MMEEPPHAQADAAGEETEEVRAAERFVAEARAILRRGGWSV